MCVKIPENINISISAAILITGGDGAEQSAEVFLPWSNTTCQLPPLPDRRFHHVQARKLMCGGWESESSTLMTCVWWSRQTGGWTTLPLTLSGERRYSSAWTHGDQLVIMGGSMYSAARTSERVSSDGAITKSSFSMKYPIR